MDDDATTILLALANYQRSPNDPERGRYALEGDELRIATNLDPGRINDAVELLHEAGYVELRRYLGTSPYDFGHVELVARGRREAQRLLRVPISDTREPSAEKTGTRAVDRRYVAIEKLGEGAFGEVFRGEDRELARPVAIKFVRDEASNQDALSHARSIARVEHANIVIVFDVTAVFDPSTAVPSIAIIMQFVDGVTLEERLGQQLHVAGSGQACSEPSTRTALTALHTSTFMLAMCL